MSTLLGIARFRFRPGRREEHLRLSEQASDLVRATEPVRHELARRLEQATVIQRISLFIHGL